MKIQTIQLIYFFIFFLLCIPAGTVKALLPIPPSIVDYDIEIHIDPETRTLEGKSVVTFDKTREQRLILDAQFEVTQALINGQPYPPVTKENHIHSWEIPVAILRPQQVEIHWRGTLQTLDDSLDHEQTLGRPIAVSNTAGTFLPKAAYWYPRVVNALHQYAVEITLPPGQRGLVAGRLVKEEDNDSGYWARFEFPHPAEGIDLMAGPYEIVTDHYTGIQGEPIQLRTYFHPQINTLADDYLESVKRYFKQYETWIGAYPFSEFSIVSSPTPTGFGMPTLTYLGINVLKLPFIRDTSLGHEVLHNWWGNAVYPDYQSGNWSEGLTTFMADYTYKEQESDAAAREMRLGWLRDFAALQPGQDAPLADFTSRTHGASKIVGYNKSAMLFFMLRDLIGETLFNQSIQGLWGMQRFKVTAWPHLQKVFEIVATQNLQPFFGQWLHRTGAPDLSITQARQEKTETGYRLHMTLSQSEPSYQLQVPVSVHTASDEKTHRFDLQHTEQTFIVESVDKVQFVTLDPDVRLFRQLAPGEAPPILREIMVNSATKTVLLSDDEETKHIAVNLAEKLQRRTPLLLAENQLITNIPTLVIGLQHEIDAWLEAKDLPKRPDMMKKGTAQAWTLEKADGSTLAVVSAHDNTSLEALIRPLPHYGRQSYIVFEGRQAIDKGTWPMQPQQIAVE